jgi:hypothetical protein
MIICTVLPSPAWLVRMWFCGPGSCGCECLVVLGLAVASGIKRAANQLQLRLRRRLGLHKRLYYSWLGWAYWQLDGLPCVNSASASIVASHLPPPIVTVLAQAWLMHRFRMTMSMSVTASLRRQVRHGIGIAMTPFWPLLSWALRSFGWSAGALVNVTPGPQVRLRAVSPYYMPLCPGM